MEQSIGKGKPGVDPGFFRGGEEKAGSLGLQNQWGIPPKCFENYNLIECQYYYNREIEKQHYNQLKQNCLQLGIEFFYSGIRPVDISLCKIQISLLRHQCNLCCMNTQTFPFCVHT